MKKLGRNPEAYVREVLKACSLKQPPICERTVVDFLKIEIQELSNDEIQEYFQVSGSSDELRRHLKRECAMLRRYEQGKKEIIVYQNTMMERKRLHIFHECTHSILPWHLNFDYLCDGDALSLHAKKQAENEAFQGGAEFLMPTEVFIDDVVSLDTSIASIQALGKRYGASLEATAFRYAKKNPRICATMIIEPAARPMKESKDRRSANPCQEVLELKDPRDKEQRDTEPSEQTCPLRVKYFVPSPQFEKFIRMGTPIPRNNPIYESWVSDSLIHDKIDAAVFGSSARCKYNIECLPLGNTGNLLTLIWSPKQTFSLNLF